MLSHKFYHTYDMVDEFPMGNHSLTDIINLKQLRKLLYPFQGARSCDSFLQHVTHKAQTAHLLVKIIHWLMHGDLKMLVGFLKLLALPSICLATTCDTELQARMSRRGIFLLFMPHKYQVSLKSVTLDNLCISGLLFPIYFWHYMLQSIHEFYNTVMGITNLKHDSIYSRGEP